MSVMGSIVSFQNSQVEALTPSLSECDDTWGQGLSRGC